MPIQYNSRISPKAKGKSRELYAKDIAERKAIAGQGDLVLGEKDTKKRTQTNTRYTKPAFGPVRKMRGKPKSY